MQEHINKARNKLLQAMEPYITLYLHYCYRKCCSNDGCNCGTAHTGGTGILAAVAGAVSGFVGIGIGGIMGTYLTAIKNYY